jgi:hypothetical protein
MYISNSGPTRVVQKVAMPTVDWLTERIRYAPQMASPKTPISSTVGAIWGWKSRASTAATGSQRTMTTTFQPANAPMSETIGKSGRSSAAESCPSRMRHSQPYGVNTMFIDRTSVQTM